MGLGPEEVFICGLVAAGLVGGFATILGSVLVERFGGIVGGIAGTIPLTIIPFIVGLLLFESSDRVDETLNMTPPGMLATLVVLLVWRFLPPYLSRRFSSFQRLVTMMSLSLFLWFCIGSLFVLIFHLVDTQNLLPDYELGFVTLIAGVVALGIHLLAAILFVGFPELPVGRKGDEQVKPWYHLARFAVGCTTTTLSVLIAKYDEYAGGISIAFPCVSFTTLASLWIIHSDTVAISAVAPMVVGSASTSIFALIFAWLSPVLQAEYGKLAGIAATFGATWYLVIFIYCVPAVFLLRTKEIKDGNAFVPKMILPTDSFDDWACVTASDNGFLINEQNEAEEDGIETLFSRASMEDSHSD